MKNTKTIKLIIELTEKSKDLSLEGIDYIRKTPIHKLAAGTAIILIPGALTAVGAYALGKKMLNSYSAFKKIEENQHINFVEWFGTHSKKQVSQNIQNIRNLSNRYMNKSTDSINTNKKYK